MYTYDYNLCSTMRRDGLPDGRSSIMLSKVVPLCTLEARLRKKLHRADFHTPLPRGLATSSQCNGNVPCNTTLSCPILNASQLKLAPLTIAVTHDSLGSFNVNATVVLSPFGSHQPVYFVGWPVLRTRITPNSDVEISKLGREGSANTSIAPVASNSKPTRDPRLHSGKLCCQLLRSPKASSLQLPCDGWPSRPSGLWYSHRVEPGHGEMTLFNTSGPEVVPKKISG